MSIENLMFLISVWELHTSVSYQYMRIIYNPTWKIIYLLGHTQVKRMLNFDLDTDCKHQITKEMTHGRERDDRVLPLWFSSRTLNQERSSSMKPTSRPHLGGFYYSLPSLPPYFFKAHAFHLLRDLPTDIWPMAGYKWTLNSVNFCFQFSFQIQCNHFIETTPSWVSGVSITCARVSRLILNPGRKFIPYFPHY